MLEVGDAEGIFVAVLSPPSTTFWSPHAHDVPYPEFICQVMMLLAQKFFPKCLIALPRSFETVHDCQIKGRLIEFEGQELFPKSDYSEPPFEISLGIGKPSTVQKMLLIQRRRSEAFAEKGFSS
jgi:hypothetical protein